MSPTGICGYRTAARAGSAQRNHRSEGKQGGVVQPWGQSRDNALPNQPRISPEVGSVRDRLNVLQELGAEHGVTDLPTLAAWLGVPLHTVRKLTTRGIKRKTALKIVGGLKQQGYSATVEWVLNGTGAPPERMSTGLTLTKEGTLAPAVAVPETTHVGLIDMKSAALKITKALAEDLDRSRALVLHDGMATRERERQQALVWAFKDLARQLARMGYDMRNLFEITDELAREVGLPQRPGEKEA